MCRDKTKRSGSNILGIGDDGRPSSKLVAEGNEMVSRMCLAWSLGIAMLVIEALEQPLNSLMPQHPRLTAINDLLSALGAVFS